MQKILRDAEGREIRTGHPLTIAKLKLKGFKVVGSFENNIKKKEGEKMTYYENVYTKWGGLLKTLERKKQMGESMVIITKKYFLGIKYSEKSEMRRLSIFDNIIHAFHGGGADEET